MAKMNANTANEVKLIIEHICTNAQDALGRVGRVASADEMSSDDFKILAKEVEEVGELIHQLERINPHIVPALFEVRHGQWRGWSGLANYRNTLAHGFRRITPQELFEHASNTLSLNEVTDLLRTVRSISMMTQSFDFGSVSDVRRLPKTQEHGDLLPGASLILLRFDDAGELMAARSWRDMENNWRAATRWVQTVAENEEHITLNIRDTEMRLVPTLISPDGTMSDDGQRDDPYNLFSLPSHDFVWEPRVISQADSSLVRKRT